ncbi:hypothetical protein B0T20DRAFT_5262 [Sordaria brevicollis]|uniref:FAD-binding domain-containing protein n=1 Tax=Sordaria brevicollis TaxID=83679 RepID=A0AAE0UG90_SORBR|nr:hypothetical protein B0T20DRAFT_5262 [Sordaria brevicollis]
MTTAPHPFRAIIVGGGPVGLTAAHAFYRAGIDFVVLERQNEIAVPEARGAGIGVMPNTLRLMAQLGLLEAVEAIGTHMRPGTVVTSDGKPFSGLDTDAWCREFHGIGWVIVHRPELMKLLYDTLPDEIKQRLLPGKEVDMIETTEDGVMVRCTDGSVEKGSIVVGADGVHSKVRDCMRRIALQESPKAAVNEEKPFVATYRCVFGHTVNPPSGINPGEEWHMHGSGMSSLLLAGKEKTWFVFSQKLPKPTRDRRRYTEQDTESFIKELGHVHCTSTVTLDDLYQARTSCYLTDLHEGLIQHFHHGRIVLVGDAVSKQTYTTGQGWNTGVQDVVVLTNKLRSMMENETNPDAPISKCKIEAAFSAYQKDRNPVVQQAVKASMVMTRTEAWNRWYDWFSDRHVLPRTGGLKMLYRAFLVPANTSAQVLEFLEEKNRPSGTIPWLHGSKKE